MKQPITPNLNRCLQPSSAWAPYRNTALRIGPRREYPVHLLPKGSEHLMGVTEESLEGTAVNLLTPAFARPRLAARLHSSAPTPSCRNPDGNCF